MVISRLMKKRKSTYENTSSARPPIQSLPKELLVEVVSRVASKSVRDLHSMKMCCKKFLDASEDKYVWQHATLEKLPITQWFPNEKQLSFLKRCLESGNIESIYREGLKEFFDNPKGNINGLTKLKTAAQRGLMESKYVYGMILLCSQYDELRTQGLEYMRFLRKSMCIIKCREKVHHLLVNHFWKPNGMLVRNQTPLCHSKNTCKGWTVKKGAWIFRSDEDDDINLCEYCRWDHELDFFYRLCNVRE